MATLADSLVSSAARPLSVRVRPDLEVTKQRYQGRQYWIIKDPVGLNYFRFQEEEFALLNWLDGQSSLDELRNRFEKQFAPQKITLEELGRLIGMLHQSGLVIAAMPGQGKQLLNRRWERKKKEILGALSNILAIRFKGIDPERILNWLNPKFGWIFTRPAFILWLLTFLSALSLVMVQFDTFQQKLPSFHKFFGPENWFVLAAAMGITKVLHEFGHGLSCKHFGGECHEMGVMVLVLTPCLYCNVSDSWMLPNKWHRAFIGAAGMYVEIFLASIATFIWWFSQPGLLNNVALSTIFVCSVSTVVFNGNPLLRYDGYYILSDLLEIPNLRQKATTILTRKLGSWCLGLEQQDDPFLPKRNQMMFAVYSVAASIYSWVVVFSILFFLYKVFKPHRLEIIGQMIAAMSLVGLVVRPLWKMGKFFYVPGRTDQVKKPRMFATLALVCAAIGVIVFFPFPYRVYSAFEIQPHRAEHVYVKDVEGELTAVSVEAGQKVTAGMQLAQLRSIDLELKEAELKGQLEQDLVRLKMLRDRRQLDPNAEFEIGLVEKSRQTVEEQLVELQEDMQRLTLIAGRDGVIIPPPAAPEKPSPDGRLSKWHGTPLEKRNLNSTLSPGTMFCQIGDPRKFDAILVVDQAEIEMIRAGQRVEMMLEEMPGEKLEGVVSAIAPEEMKVAPRHLSNEGGGSLATKTDPSGVQRPASTYYQVEVPLDDPDGMLLVGLKGEARIDAGKHSLGWRLWRFLKQTFHFRL
ncbi:MAG: efflux RND transporter periplasmic adaptor subunit [Pirellulales bacterium]|nr:efflux RND transporter periplasmic adaptor subunit [Pirellulales bacterium]